MGVGGVYIGFFVGVFKGVMCFECEIIFSNVNNYYVYKCFYCLGCCVFEDVFVVCRFKVFFGLVCVFFGLFVEFDVLCLFLGFGVCEDGVGGVVVFEDGVGGWGSEGS